MELIHTNICSNMHVPYFMGEEYFIAFIDDYSSYDYVYLIKESSTALNVFKLLKSQSRKAIR